MSTHVFISSFVSCYRYRKESKLMLSSRALARPSVSHLLLARLCGYTFLFSFFEIPIIQHQDCSAKFQATWRQKCESLIQMEMLSSSSPAPQQAQQARAPRSTNRAHCMSIPANSPSTPPFLVQLQCGYDSTYLSNTNPYVGHTKAPREIPMYICRCPRGI